jgi:hypothetical protein
MNERRDDVLDEAILRRSLRLEDDERGPRFDAIAIAAMAKATAPSSRTLAVALVATAGTGLTATAVWSVALGSGPQLLDRAIALALQGVVTGATLLLPIAEIAAQPVVPLSLLAALGVAIFHELRERRDHAYADAS